ncbi:MAG: ABC transporter substrate-binding protein [Nitrosopumilaceae archaeon]|nr:cobalamin-binding protein [Nitrosopumilaceae archaeon]NIT99763.1 cobalamin-binding protein [Nitrosopumilaceae archaeon]NIU88625.1 ABC transporter substrate-binding protein [Nitrosopumilaceae archaeon]NIV64899.1 ABC transporter substrate-binding protein [Nitrosopumilaceae archaeon]NIX60366.1 ABC transporter substrate-binding protein [Nitrosopumilaceae archaeon]
MTANRVVSFLPSATELLYELNASDILYGVTHECTYPEEAKTKPRVIRSVIDSDRMSSKEIDQKVNELASSGEDIYQLDEENIKKASPDLIISQLICEVCSAHTNQVNKALKIVKSKPKVYSYTPHDVDGILETINDVAELVNRKEEGKKLQTRLQEKIEKTSSQKHDSRPSVLALEWLEPFYSAGHWVPQMINISGGKNAIGKTGDHSFRISYEKVLTSNPDIIILMPCGFDTDRTKIEYENTLKNDEKWAKLRAVRKGNVFAVDANSYFSKPSIRTITGIEILNKIIHPEKFEESLPSDSYLQLR